MLDVYKRQGLEVKDAAGNKISIYEAIAKNVASLTAFKNTLSYSSDEYKTITAMVKFHDAMVVLFGSDYATTEVSDTEFGAGIIKTVLEDKDGSASVSYTHLDVYKRQQWKRMRMNDNPMLFKIKLRKFFTELIRLWLPIRAYFFIFNCFYYLYLSPSDSIGD